MRNRSKISVTLAVLLGMSAAPVFGIDIPWDGNGDSNAGGNWTLDDNWDGDVLPTTDDRVILPSVTDSSTRTTIQDDAAGITINALRFVQDGPTGVNKLSLGGNITLSKGSRNAATPDSATSAFQVELTGGATVDQVQVDLNGYSIIIPNTFSTAQVGGNLHGTINFNQDGSRIYNNNGSHMNWNVFGVINASADGMLGRRYTAAGGTGIPTINMMAGSELNVTAGQFDLEAQGRVAGNNTFTLNNAGAIDIAAGATLGHVWTATAGSGVGNMAFNNNAAGTMNQAGALQLRLRYDGATLNVNNHGLWTIDGESAVIRRLSTTGNAANIVVPNFNISATGILTGATALDAVEFDEQVADGTRRMAMTNNGTITPGAGSNGAGLASVGVLGLRDIDLTVGETGKIVLDFGGYGSGEFDQLLLEAGLTDAAGAGTLDLTAVGNTLELFSVNGYTAGDEFSVALITAGSVAGQFDNVTLDGVPFVGNTLDGPGDLFYQISYTGTSVNLSLVPEPASMALLGLGGLMMLNFRGRRR